jgi:PTH1 family peptidyl-tRNA hydrolase
MFLIVGLGNPGPKYTWTRHNAGFLLVDELASRHQITINQEKFNGIAGKGLMQGQEVLLLKPMTFMNLSGRCVSGWLRYFKLRPEQCIVIYDDLDLEPCRVKARLGGSSGGHNGIKSILQELGEEGFHRLKIGIGKPPKDERNQDTVSWVLGPLGKEEIQAYGAQVFDDVTLRLKGIFDAHGKNE